MTTLKEATWEVSRMQRDKHLLWISLHGRVEPKTLRRIHSINTPIYDILEATAMMHGLSNDVPNIKTCAQYNGRL